MNWMIVINWWLVLILIHLILYSRRVYDYTLKESHEFGRINIRALYKDIEITYSIIYLNRRSMNHETFAHLYDFSFRLRLPLWLTLSSSSEFSCVNSILINNDSQPSAFVCKYSTIGKAEGLSSYWKRYYFLSPWYTMDHARKQFSRKYIYRKKTIYG